LSNSLRFRFYRDQLKSLPPGQLIKKVFRRVYFEFQVQRDQIQDVQQASHFWTRSIQYALNTNTMLENLAQNFRASFRESFFIEPGQRAQTIEWLRTVAPQAEALILAEANRICAHEFDLFGSGIVPLGEEIDWHIDFKSGHRWNPSTYFKRIRPAAYPGGFDIKVPWELSRCQHFPRLGQAYWLTDDEKYAQEWVAQVSGWIETNPWPYGVNWASTMDVSIRVINWLWGLAFFLDSPHLTDPILIEILTSLLQHSRHIRSNLEVYPGMTNNHYLADLVGLIYAGILLPQFQEAQNWREFGIAELEKQMFLQVYSDGVNFEASISYHRLAAEIFLSAVFLSQRNGNPFSAAFMSRLEKMLEFTLSVTRSDGSVPLIGDNDNGRIFRLKAWPDPDLEWIDHRYLLAIGAVLFNRQDFARAAGNQWEEAIWLYGSHAMHSIYPQVEKNDSVALGEAFPVGGLYILHSPDFHIVVDAGRNGQNGNGGHAHNDLLSFELFAFNHPWIIDSGTLVYTADYEARRRFRSTPFHNVLQVDGAEQIPQDARQPSRLLTDPAVRILEWEPGTSVDRLAAEHDGYLRLPVPATHRREFILNKPGQVLSVHDQLTSTGSRALCSWLHFHPQTVLEPGAANTVNIRWVGFLEVELQVEWKTDTICELEIERNPVALGYGTDCAAPYLALRTQGTWIEMLIYLRKE
jgi:hypothetical protein